MLIFSINSESNEAKTASLKNQLTTVIPVEVKRYDVNSSLSLDREYMFEKHGFYLSKYERDHFNTHFEIWKEFRNSNAPFCLIINENASIKSHEAIHIEQLIQKLSENDNWDIYFPFEKSEVEDDNDVEPGYLLGCYWGIDAYFINRKGADKLLDIKVLRRPLDEEILTKSVLGELEVYSEEINHFDFQENTIQKKERKLAIKDAIFQSKAWSSESKKRIQNIMLAISKLANDNDIDLILCDGSLLGHVRHGGIMPWDDDVDLGLNIGDYEKFKFLIENNTSLTSSLCHWGSPKISYYKIWDKDGQPIDRYSHTFPFVDIWFFTDKEDQIIFDAGTVYPKEIYYPLSEVSFEGSIFKLPAKPQECLDISYKNWKNQIQVFPWPHQLEQNSVIPLSHDITVDDNGRIMEDA